MMPTFHSVFEKLTEKWDPLRIITLYIQFTENLTHCCSLLNYRVLSPTYHVPIELKILVLQKWLTWKWLDYPENAQCGQVSVDYTLQLRCRVPQSVCKCQCQHNTAPLYRKYWLKTQEYLQISKGLGRLWRSHSAKWIEGNWYGPTMKWFFSVQYLNHNNLRPLFQIKLN